VVIPCRDGSRVFTSEWASPISGECPPIHRPPFRSPLQYKLQEEDRERRGPRWPVRTSIHLFRVFTQPAPVTMGCRHTWNHTPPQWWLPNREAGPWLYQWTGGQYFCRLQATAQLDDRGRSPPIVSLGHPTALVPRIPQEVLPPTAEVDIPTITPSHWEHFTPQLSPLLWYECQMLLPHNNENCYTCGGNTKSNSYMYVYT